MTMKKRLRIGLNIFIVVTVFAAWAYMFTNKKPGALASAGILNLKFFTVLSNLAEGFVSLSWLICVFLKRKTEGIEKAKYAAAVSVGLTFATIAFFLGPIYGMLSLYKGANFWFHLIIPLTAMVEFVFWSETKADRNDNVKAVIPMLLYGTVYLANILIRGREGNDWYGFANRGLPTGIVIFAMLCLATYGIGAMLRIAKSRIR